MLREQLEEVIEKIEAEPCISEEITFLNLKDYLKDIINIFLELIEELPELKEQGIELPEDVILQQVKNLNEAVAHKDVVKLYDTFKYEIINTLQIYKEIEMERKKA